MTTQELITKAEKAQAELELLAQWAQSKHIGAIHESDRNAYNYQRANVAFASASDEIARGLKLLRQLV